MVDQLRVYAARKNRFKINNSVQKNFEVMKKIFLIGKLLIVLKKT